MEREQTRIFRAYFEFGNTLTHTMLKEIVFVFMLGAYSNSINTENYYENPFTVELKKPELKKEWCQLLMTQSVFASIWNFWDQKLKEDLSKSLPDFKSTMQKTIYCKIKGLEEEFDPTHCGLKLKMEK